MLKNLKNYKIGRNYNRNGAPEGIRTPDRSVRSRLLYPAELLVRRDNKNGAPEGIRTPDRSVRSRLLYPAELLVRVISYGAIF